METITLALSVLPRLWLGTLVFSNSHLCEPESCVCQVLQKGRARLDRVPLPVIPPEPPVAEVLLCRNGAQGARARRVWRGGANPCARAPFGHAHSATGGPGGMTHPAGGPRAGSSLLGYFPHLLLLVLFQEFHVQIPGRLDPVFMHLHRQGPHQS